MGYRVVLISQDGIFTGELSEAGRHFDEREIQPEYIAFPTFFNAHVHLNDAVALDPPRMALDEMVGPGGYKFRVIWGRFHDISHALRAALDLKDTSHFLEFREGGEKALRVLEAAGVDGVLPLARPGSIEEARKIARKVRGFALSSVRDHDVEFIEELRSFAKRKDLIFAIHAGEKDNEDVEGALSLEPDLLIHMNRARKDQLRMAMNEEVPIVSCIRSNFFFGLENMENYDILTEYHNWMIGTDNAMICSPSILDELSFASFVMGREENLFAASLRGHIIFGTQPRTALVEVKPFRFSENFIHTLVRRVSSAHVSLQLPAFPEKFKL
jgi:cytosine/adenosine deaminase-related metal-dependent hydrolase